MRQKAPHRQVLHQHGQLHGHARKRTAHHAPNVFLPGWKNSSCLCLFWSQAKKRPDNINRSF